VSRHRYFWIINSDMRHHRAEFHVFDLTTKLIA
jgi:hypothetical protein